jgi:hypothetical protein
MINAPTMGNMVEGGKPPFLSARKLEQLGFDIALFQVFSLYATAQSICDKNFLFWTLIIRDLALWVPKTIAGEELRKKYEERIPRRNAARSS